MRRLLRILLPLVLVLVPVGAGIALVVQAVSKREPPAPQERAEPATAVRVITIEPASFLPEVSAFGSVEPASTWKALAQVAGEAAWIAPDLRPGRLVEAGAELVRIDAADYELAEAQATSRLAGGQARLAELETRRENLDAALEIERRAFALSEAELQRRRTLLERGATSQTAVDQAEEAVLQRRGRVQEIENQLRLLPAQARVQEAEKAIAESQLAAARRSIERTVVTMPFDGRISEVTVERGQYVAGGQLMVAAESIARVEVSARLRPDQVRLLTADRLGTVSAFDLSAAEIDAIPRDFGLSAELRFDLGGRLVTWQAQVLRASFALDPQTRTIGIVVGVDDPLRHAIAGERPPLVGGMFVEVLLRGLARENATLVPREALERDGEGWAVHIADEEDRLRRRLVEVDGMFGNTALLESGLARGDRVVVGELGVAIEGMLLAPREDEAMRQRLAAPELEAAR